MDGEGLAALVTLRRSRQILWWWIAISERDGKTLRRSREHVWWWIAISERDGKTLRHSHEHV